MKKQSQSLENRVKKGTVVGDLLQHNLIIPIVRPDFVGYSLEGTQRLDCIVQFSYYRFRSGLHMSPNFPYEQSFQKRPTYFAGLAATEAELIKRSTYESAVTKDGSVATIVYFQYLIPRNEADENEADNVPDEIADLIRVMKRANLSKDIRPASFEQLRNCVEEVKAFESYLLHAAKMFHMIGQKKEMGDYQKEDVPIKNLCSPKQ